MIGDNIKFRWIKVVAVLVVSIVLIYLLLNNVLINSDVTDIDKDYAVDGELIFMNTSPDVKYVGSESCKDCHLEIYEAYKNSPTGRSMSRMESTNVIEKFPQEYTVYDTAKKYYYEMVEKEGKYFQREYRFDNEGNLVHDLWVEAQYIIGSGSNLRMYFYDENGMFYQLPLTWYVHEQRWDMSPGYSEFNNVRFSRFVGEMCFSCHNGYMPQLDNANNRYKKPYTLGIGCEACHGPGDLHVRQTSGEEIELPSENALTIVNPPKLSPQRRNDVCLQCHLEGKTWALHDGKNWFDFRPGLLLEDHRSVYAPSQKKKEIFRVANTGYRLFLSRCFQGSHGTMTCDICHDSHGMIQQDRKLFNRRNCLRCHPLESVPARMSRFHESRADCIRCHMNQTGKSNTLHGVINTDHWIRINSDWDDINWFTERHRSEVLSFTSLVDRNDSLAIIRKGIAFAEYYFTEDNKTAYLDSAAKYLYAGLSNNTTSVYGNYYMGRVLRAKGKFDEAIIYLNHVIKQDPEFSAGYYELAQIYKIQNDFKTAVLFLRDALKYKKNEPTYLEELGVCLNEAGSIDEAVKVLERSIKIDSRNPFMYFLLGNIYIFKLNDSKIALGYYKKAVELNPDITDGLINLGNTYAILGEYEKAIESYKKELVFREESVKAYINIARVYTFIGDTVSANDALNKARSINPALNF
jgi:tetratricopeptide (TPR) repeat protein